MKKRVVYSFHEGKSKRASLRARNSFKRRSMSLLRVLAIQASSVTLTISDDESKRKAYSNWLILNEAVDSTTDFDIIKSDAFEQKSKPIQISDHLDDIFCSQRTKMKYNLHFGCC